MPLSGRSEWRPRGAVDLGKIATNGSTGGRNALAGRGGEAIVNPAELSFGFVERCGLHRSMQALFDDLADCVRALGIDHLILTRLPVPEEGLEGVVLEQNWPSAWFRRYGRRNYFSHDAVGQWAVRTKRPFLWKETPPDLAARPEFRRISGEAREFGLADGFVVPMCSARGRQAALSFSSRHKCEFGTRERAALHLMALYAYGAAMQLVGEHGRIGRLTEREQEVLRWAADGKTAWETSVILRISERTVAKHLEAVRRKLDVTTTSQAVAVALQNREIVVQSMGNLAT
ncbi:autoinducer-binding protein [Rhizobiales bacterium L72]|uniref:Autoinducer-binding protein n=2 Tax=Propylenella binzhouense TaxID=2555902 RepID=A0A964T8T1_9HYPH|nr:autoinducer-binding protein [Propylenella binzhouense]